MWEEIWLVITGILEWNVTEPELMIRPFFSNIHYYDMNIINIHHYFQWISLRACTLNTSLVPRLFTVRSALKSWLSRSNRDSWEVCYSCWQTGARAGRKKLRKEGIDYKIQLEHGHLKWKVCALWESKVVMKWFFRNWIILILLIIVVWERSMRSLGNEFQSRTTRLK